MTSSEKSNLYDKFWEREKYLYEKFWEKNSYDKWEKEFIASSEKR